MMLRAHQFILLSLVLVVLSCPQCFADLYSTDAYGNSLVSGSLSSVNLGGLTVGSNWVDATVGISWNLSRDIVGGTEVGPWHYSYTFTASSAPALSHILFEVSSGVTEDVGPFTLGFPDYLNGPTADLQTYNSTDPSNPSNPLDTWSVFGIKFEDMFSEEDESGAPVTSWTINFDSWRNPMWGSFYAKGGNDSFAYNTGLAGGDAFVAVPDTSYVPVPGAFLLGMIGLGFAGVKLRRFA